MNLKEEYEQETGESATFTNVNFAQLPTPQYAEWLESKLKTPQPEGVKPEESEINRRDLARIRNYFGENDSTPFEHWAYTYLDSLMKQQLDDRVGCFHCGKRIDKDALYCPYCLKAS